MTVENWDGSCKAVIMPLHTDNSRIKAEADECDKRSFPKLRKLAKDILGVKEWPYSSTKIYSDADRLEKVYELAEKALAEAEGGEQ
jgi:hypothetical protein